MGLGICSFLAEAESLPGSALVIGSSLGAMAGEASKRVRAPVSDLPLTANHVYKVKNSLPATAATQLYQAGVDEQLTMERTGYRSLNGVRSYNRTNLNQ